MKHAHLLFFLLFVTAFAQDALAYRLKAYHPTAEERDRRAEDVLHDYEHRPHTRRLAPDIAFWKRVVNLKQTLQTLPGDPLSGNGEKEADLLAKEVMIALYDISARYRVIGWPRLNNVAVKLGLRKRGYCYHYADDLRKHLSAFSWQTFTISWAESYGGTRRESNALAIRRTGSPFESGIVIDPWRTGSKPYWHTVTKDRWPWKELTHVMIEE